MKLFSVFLLAGAVLSASPIPASSSAQVSLANAGTPLMDDGSYYVGPYTLSINGQNVAALCVDFKDESYVGQSWTASLSQVGGNVSATYNPTDNLQYEQEAYLYSLITQPNADRIDIQHAAWNITDPSFSINSAAEAFVTQAQAGYSTMNFSSYEIVSATDGSHAQEFMVSNAPEPASFTLLAAGLLLGGLGLARRKKPAQL